MLSATNKAFDVHSNGIQTQPCVWTGSIGRDCQLEYSYILTATVQHSPQNSGYSGLQSLGPGFSVYCLPGLLAKHCYGFIISHRVVIEVYRHTMVAR